MRKLIALFAAITVSVAASASAGTASLSAKTFSLSLKTSSYKVLYGHELTLSGRLSNGSANQAVTIYGRPVGLVMIKVATVKTDQNGRWTFKVGPAIGATYQARAGAIRSPAVSIGVEPAIATRLVNGGVWATVAGGAFQGRTLHLQRANGAAWTTIASSTLNSDSDAFFAAPLTQGKAMMRIAMSVNQAGAGYLGASSHSFTFRAFSVTLATPASSVRYGGGVTLTGRIGSGLAGQLVTILVRRYSSSAPVPLTTTRSKANGIWARTVEPRIGTTYQALWNGYTSRTFTVGVQPALTVTRLAGGNLAVRIAPERAFVGRNIELQRMIGTSWKTIDQTPLLGPKGHADFAVPVKSGTATLRVAMSVNQAGVGYLGAASQAIAYHVAALSIAPSAYSVLYGHSLTLAGNISSGRAGGQVTILARPYGRSTPAAIATVFTTAGGRWSFEPKPSVRTSYTAVWGSSKSRAIVIGVEPLVAINLRADRRIAAQVTASKALRDRMVQLQQLTAPGQWTTITQLPLDRTGHVVFPAPTLTGDQTLRVALSVNQAGAGLLGARSHPFLYHGV